MANGNHTPVTGSPDVRAGINAALSELDSAIGVIGAFNVAMLGDAKTNGSDGGSSVSGWQVRNINDIEIDDDGIMPVASNQFTPAAGQYILIATATAYAFDSGRLALYNATQASYVAYGAAVSDGLSADMLSASIFAIFTANGTDAYELRHYIQDATATNGLGFNDSASLGDEVYMQMVLMRFSV